MTQLDTVKLACATLCAGAFAAHAEAIDASAFSNLPPADITILGELHDRVDHHENQARAVAAISPKAIVFEMLTPEEAAIWQDSAVDDASLTETLRKSETSWTGFEMYFAIFQAAPDAAIYGAALPPEDVRAAVSDSASGVFTGESVIYGLDAPLEASEQTVREMLQAEAHCDALPLDLLPEMVEAQRLRDASFAKTALDALAETGPPIVVITGNGHARTDWGIPRFLERVAPEVSVLSVGQLGGAPQDPPFDLWTDVDAPPSTSDPCEAVTTN